MHKRFYYKTKKLEILKNYDILRLTFQKLYFLQEGAPCIITNYNEPYIFLNLFVIRSSFQECLYLSMLDVVLKRFLKIREGTDYNVVLGKLMRRVTLN